MCILTQWKNLRIYKTGLFRSFYSKQDNTEIMITELKTVTGQHWIKWCSRQLIILCLCSIWRPTWLYSWPFLAFLSLVMRINCAPPTSGNQTTVPPVSVITQKVEVQEEDEKVGVTEKVTNETTTATPPTTVSPSPKPVETTTKTTKLPLPDPSATASVSGIISD